MLYEVIPTRVFRQGADFLTYSSDIPLEPGHIVLIPLGKSTIPGIVYKKHLENPTFTIKPITRLLYKTPLPPHLMKSLLWLSSYYLLPLPSVASLFLPIGVEKNRRKKPEPPLSNAKIPIIPLNNAQKQALVGLQEAPEYTRLLHGVTGSGKTNIYLHLASECLTNGFSTILLVPEIALPSQLVSIFESTFGRHVTLIHSRQTEAERHAIWEHLLVSHDPQIIIGPRSALFAPLKNLGLIIIDESHEPAYYQENSPRYSALRLASFMARTLKIPCIQGTATPLVSDFYIASSRNSLIPLTEKAKDTAITPEITVVDFKNRENFKKNRYFSDKLITTIKDNLKNHHQTLIFHNRRGSAPLTLCEKCGWQALCPHCFIPLTLHSDSFQLVCHACGFSEPTPHSCPECHTPGIIHKGFGTKLLEAEVKKLFPEARVARFDADNGKNETLDSLYSDVRSGSIDIIIGTQTIARGLDLPHLASVGIVQADAGLSLPDFASEEKTFHLLTQVIGRVGRGHLDTASVVIQTYQPDHPAIQCALTSDYARFSSYLLESRKKQHFPPFYFLAKLTITAKTESTVVKKIRAAKAYLDSYSDKLLISQPTPVLHERSTTGYTWQIILRARSRTALLDILRDLDPKLDVKITLDPPSLL